MKCQCIVEVEYYNIWSQWRIQILVFKEKVELDTIASQSDFSVFVCHDKTNKIKGFIMHTC